MPPPTSGPDVHLRQFFPGADDQAADDRARYRFETAEYQDRQRLQREKSSASTARHCAHPTANPPPAPRTRRPPRRWPRSAAAECPGERRLMVVRDRAQRPPDARGLKKQRQSVTSTAAMPATATVELGDVHAGRVGDPLPRLVRDADVEPVRLRCPREAAPGLRRRRTSPMVAMNRVIGGWLTSGRNTRRSVNRPSTTIASRVSGRASQKCKSVLDQADDRSARRRTPSRPGQS